VSSEQHSTCVWSAYISYGSRQDHYLIWRSNAWYFYWYRSWLFK